MNKEFGKRMRVFRDHTGLTQTEFAKKVSPETTQGNVSSWEKGHVPEGENLELIYAAYPELSRDWLINNKGSMLVDSTVLLDKKEQPQNKYYALLEKYSTSLEEKSALEKEVERLRRELKNRL